MEHQIHRSVLLMASCRIRLVRPGVERPCGARSPGPLCGTSLSRARFIDGQATLRGWLGPAVPCAPACEPGRKSHPWLRAMSSERDDLEQVLQENLKLRRKLG